MSREFVSSFPLSLSLPEFSLNIFVFFNLWDATHMDHEINLVDHIKKKQTNKNRIENQSAFHII